MTQYRTCAVCGERRISKMFNRSRYGICDRVCRECRKNGCDAPPLTEREKRLDKKAHAYAKDVLYPEYGNWHLALTRARSAYGL